MGHLLRTILFHFSHIFAFPASVVLFRFRSYGIGNIPLVGPVIIASNHTSVFDPPLIANGQLRVLYYMAKSELFRNPLFRALIVSYGAFPVRRGEGDIRAMRIALKLLSKGRVVLVFPEGTRSKTGELNEGKEGAGMLVYKAKAKVIPTYIKNSNKILIPGKGFQLPKIEIWYGKPIEFGDLLKRKPSKELYRVISQSIMDEVAKLKYEADRDR
ncbi:MAG: 1-acyl-sn-glycerol-3-phosphate acyltransferase [Candidatus Coatesbacteria bacterium]|nr:MAG: 1-acyl-sn-glycerol-3-phosphate acyltransferase [Candidatus Coatesbacteria bacterium]RLC41934.1 MAG: 1-acyl-sn-glycerol-3-phosphate acyltransferase [Candidatus Coatesbacteria bacterium]RLC44588.1 MAG: 1-acyl-sn-glycerol-3-phosphate acyltransferase [Candidatus Coatesbacteria bacterium]